jgi:hypothetical protein
MRASRPFLGSFLGGRVILKQDVGMEWRLDLRSAEMIGAASSQAATLVREVSTETMLAIRKIIVDAQEQGLSIPQQARRIRDMGLGLTQRQATAVLNFERMLVEQGLSPDVVARRTERYYKRAIKRRATLIARTETMHAANMGQQEMWRQAWKDGLLSPQTRRVWIVTPDDKLCPFCRSLGRKYGPNSGGGTMLEEQFVSDPIQRQNGSFRGIEPSLTPPAHPGCRCAMALKTIEPGAAQPIVPPTVRQLVPRGPTKPKPKAKPRPRPEPKPEWKPTMTQAEAERWAKRGRVMGDGVYMAADKSAVGEWLGESTLQLRVNVRRMARWEDVLEMDAIGPRIMDLASFSGPAEYAEWITRQLRALGYDGIIADNPTLGIIVFDPKRVVVIKRGG